MKFRLWWSNNHKTFSVVQTDALCSYVNIFFGNALTIEAKDKVFLEVDTLRNFATIMSSINLNFAINKQSEEDYEIIFNKEEKK